MLAAKLFKWRGRQERRGTLRKRVPQCEDSLCTGILGNMFPQPVWRIGGNAG